MRKEVTKPTVVIPDKNLQESEGDKKEAHLLAIMCGLMSGLSFALASFIQSDLSERLGMRVASSTMPVCFLSCAYYHVMNNFFKYENDGDSLKVYRKRHRKPKESYRQSLLVKTNLVVQDSGKSTGELDIQRLLLPLVRAIMSVGTQICIYMTFYFGSLCKVRVNAGLLSSLFSTSIFFTSLLFFLFYGQKLTGTTLLGMGLIMGSVFLISVSPSGESEYEYSD